MQRKIKICFFGLLAVIFICGCSATQELKTSITSKVSSITSTVDPALVSQVPADKKGGFPKAEFALNLANQKVKLAEQKNDLAATQKKYAGLEEDLANNFQKEAEIDYDLIKNEALIDSDLGEKEDNIKLRAKLQSKKLNVQADRVKIKADIEETKRKIEYLSMETAKMDEAVKAMKFDDGKKAEPEPDGKKQ